MSYLFKIPSAKPGQQKSGFTIIETLVAITIMMIAIAGPLSVASKGLTAAVYARDQMTATYLAQEGLEYIKNSRDNNLTGSQPWMNGFSGCANVGSLNACDVGALDGFTATPICPTTSVTPGCQLYLTPWGYSHDSGSDGTASQFYRYFTISSALTNPNTDEVTVDVVVSWKDNNIPYQVDLSSQLLNTQR